MTRYRMNKILKLLKTGSLDAEALRDPKNQDALLALESCGCVKLSKTWGNDIVGVVLLSKASLYRVQRSEIWLNRVISFFIGVASTVVATLLLHVIL